MPLPGVIFSRAGRSSRQTTCTARPHPRGWGLTKLLLMRAWPRITLRAAALYNLAFGLGVVLAPDWWFAVAGLDPPRYPSLWQCIGMIVGVYGIGYWIAARAPDRHWPIVLVGLLGKVFGPIGFVLAASRGELPWRAGWLIVTNDLIWWIPFALLLARARLGSSQAGPAARLGT